MIVLSPEFTVGASMRCPLAAPLDTIFPLTIAQFEGLSLNAPHDAHKYLTLIYGNYMFFPRRAISLHDPDERCKRVEDSGADMDEVMRKLLDMEKFFRAEL